MSSKNSFKQENLKSLFRNSSTQLLKQYFDSQNLLPNINLEEKRKGKKDNAFLDFLINEIEKIEVESTKNQVISDLHKIYLMRKEEAILSFIREEELKEETINKIKELNNYDQSFTLFLEEKEKFEEFYLVYDAFNLNKKWWSARNDYIEENKKITDDSVNQLLSEAEKELAKENKGGKICKKRVILGNKEFIFAFYEDSTTEQLAIKDDEVISIFSNPINKIVFFINKEKGFIKIYGADKATRSKMHKAAAKALFDKEEIAEEQEKNEIYDLEFAFDELINNQAINFNINPSKNVKSIIPITTRLLLKETGETTEILAGKCKGNYNDLYQSLSKLFAMDKSSQNSVEIATVEPLWMSFAVFYQDPYHKHKISDKTIKITNKNNISGINEEDIDFEILDCLEEAGILKAKEIKEGQEPANNNELNDNQPNNPKHNQAI